MIRMKKLHGYVNFVCTEAYRLFFNVFNRAVCLQIIKLSQSERMLIENYSAVVCWFPE